MSWLAVLSLLACGDRAWAPSPAEVPPPEPAPQPAAAPADGGAAAAGGARGASALCLPLVSGCGCAYRCGTSVRRNADGTYEIIHDGLDSTTVTAEVQSWCFDEAGRGSPATAAGGTGCREVFYDRSGCGGECVPTTPYLTCHLADGGGCVP